MARMTSSSSSPAPSATPQLMTHKTSPSSTDTACSQDEDDQPLELTSHPVTCSVTTSVPPLGLSSASQPQQLTLAGNALRWTGHGYEICPPNSVLFSAYCDANVLMQTGTFMTVIKSFKFANFPQKIVKIHSARLNTFARS